MKTNVINISPLYPAKFWVSTYRAKSCQPIRLQNSLNCNILRKKWMMKFIFCMLMKFIFCMLINIKVFFKLILLFWVSVTKHSQSTKNKFAYLCNVSIKAWQMKLIFCLQINTNIFYKMRVSLRVCLARHTQITENNDFTISLQYLNENPKDEVDFLLADKCQRFLQSNIIILGVCGQACPNYPK